MTSAPKWLTDLPVLPRVISVGLGLLGVAEVVGRGSSKTILSWRDELNRNGVTISGYSDDGVAWCGLFVAFVCFKAGKPVVKNPLWARNWVGFGTKVPKPGLGDVLVFARGSGGHVGFYVGEDRTAYHVLGGNQGNQVSIRRLGKNRLIAARRPPYNVTPATVKPYHLAATGALSSDEA